LKKIRAQYTIYLKNDDCIDQTLELLQERGFASRRISGTPPTITCKIEKDKCIDILNLDNVILELNDMTEYTSDYEYKNDWRVVFPMSISSIITGLTVFGAVSSISNVSYVQAGIIAGIPAVITFLTQFLYKFFPEDTL
jgi:hypothetical protein